MGIKKYCIDIDGTICSNTYGKYEDAQPYKDRIETINKLHKEGNEIILFTARGTTTGIDWNNFTKNNFLNGMSCMINLFGKPEADIYIDDKAKDSFDWFNE